MARWYASPAKAVLRQIDLPPFNRRRALGGAVFVAIWLGCLVAVAVKVAS